MARIPENLDAEKQSWIGQGPISLGRAFGLFRAAIAVTAERRKNYMNQLINLKCVILIPLVLVCLALSPTARAVTPAPDGGYPGHNTAEGTDALFNLTAAWRTRP